VRDEAVADEEHTAIVEIANAEKEDYRLAYRHRQQ
jgi:hypothetical protein